MASASEILKAYLHCARTPAEDAVERIRTQLKKQYGAAEVELTVSVDKGYYDPPKKYCSNRWRLVTGRGFAIHAG